MKKLTKVLGITIALTGIGVAVKARVKENKTDLAVRNSNAAFQKVMKTIEDLQEIYQFY